MLQEDDPERQRLQVPGAAGNLMYGHGQTNNHHMTKVRCSEVMSRYVTTNFVSGGFCQECYVTNTPEFCSGDTLLTSFLLPSIIPGHSVRLSSVRGL